MARIATINNEELIDKLSIVFRDLGYEGASLTALSAATGLKKASLYHRFPGGKEEMAHEVLQATKNWMQENIFDLLKNNSDPVERVAQVVKNLDKAYSGGRQACLLNMLASVKANDGKFGSEIKSIFKILINSFRALLIDAKFGVEVATERAERVVMLLHGSLVLARGMGTLKPFKSFLANLPSELLKP